MVDDESEPFELNCADQLNLEKVLRVLLAHQEQEIVRISSDSRAIKKISVYFRLCGGATGTRTFVSLSVAARWVAIQGSAAHTSHSKPLQDS